MTLMGPGIDARPPLLTCPLSPSVGEGESYELRLFRIPPTSSVRNSATFSLTGRQSFRPAPGGLGGAGFGDTFFQPLPEWDIQE